MISEPRPNSRQSAELADSISVPPALNPQHLDFVTDEPKMSRHVTGNVTGDLEKNLGKTVFACHAVVLS